MFVKQKPGSIPDPAPLTDDERRSEKIVWYWERWKATKAHHDEQYALPAFGIFFRIVGKKGADKIEDKTKLDLALRRRNFAINLKNHGGFYDWLRRQTLPAPLTEQEKTNNHLVCVHMDFHRNYNRSWNAATDPPEDFLNWFEHCDPEIYVNDKLEKHLEELTAARRGEPLLKDTGEQFVYAKDPRFEDFAIIIPPLPGEIFKLMYATHSSPSMDRLRQQPFVKEGETIAQLYEYNCGRSFSFGEIHVKTPTNIVAPVSGKIIAESGCISFESKWSEKTGPEKLGGYYMRQLAKIRPVKGSNIQNTTVKTYRHIIAFCEQFVREPDRLKQYRNTDYPADAEKLERAISLLKKHQTVTTENEEQKRLKRKAKKATPATAKKERQAKEQPASSGYADYMASKRAMNTPAPTKQTEKPKAVPKSELPPKREKVSEAVQRDKKTTKYSPQVEAARERMRVPENFMQDVLTEQFHKLVDITPKDMLDQLNQDYELLMEAASVQEPAEDAVFVQSLTLMELEANYTEADLTERHQWLTKYAIDADKIKLQRAFDYLLKHLQDRQRGTDESDD